MSSCCAATLRLKSHHRVVPLKSWWKSSSFHTLSLCQAVLKKCEQNYRGLLRCFRSGERRCSHKKQGEQNIKCLNIFSASVRRRNRVRRRCFLWYCQSVRLLWGKTQLYDLEKYPMWVILFKVSLNTSSKQPRITHACSKTFHVPAPTHTHI